MGEDKEQSLAYVAYHRESGAIVRYGGKWDLKTTRKLRKRIKQWGITCDRKRSRLG
jgi:hypothetical protein